MEDFYVLEMTLTPRKCLKSIFLLSIMNGSEMGNPLFRYLFFPPVVAVVSFCFSRLRVGYWVRLGFTFATA